MKKLLPIAIAVSTTLSTAAPSSGSVSRALSLEDVTRASSAVLRVTPVSQASVWEGGRIVTVTRVRVDQVIAGAGQFLPAAEASIRTLGGVVDHVGQRVEGEAVFVPSRASIVFVAPAASGAAEFRVVGRSQGQWAIEGTGPSAVIVARPEGVVLPRLTAPPRVALAPIASLHGVRVDRAIEAVVSAWGVTHAK